MKLAFRFTIALVAAMTLALSLNAYLRVRREVVLFEDEVASTARTMGRLLGPLVAETWETEGEARAKELVADANEREDVRIRLRFLDGSPTSPQLSPTELDKLATSGSVTRKEKDPSANDVLITYVAVSLPGHKSGILEFAEPLTGERAYVSRTILSAATTAVVLALLCAASAMGLGVLFVGRPVRALVAQARRIGAGDFSARLGLRQRDEIGDLALEFDLMSDRLMQAREELKQATEAKLAALDQLRHVERVATVGKLAAGVAHELGTPLQLVSGYARLIIDDPSSASEAHDNAHVIREQAERMTAIIRQLLDFATPRRTERTPTNLVELVEKAVRLLTPIADERNVRIEQGGDREDLTATIDGEQILQVLSNLVVNAIQAMPDGGVVRVQLDKNHRERNGVSNGFVRLRVSDTGIGMAPEVKDHVFEPFFTTKDVGSGTGLGLSVAYGIVEEQGGVIEVESTPGRGSTFAVWLPMERRA